MSGNSSIICKHDTSFGDDVLVGWDCTFIDGDAHKIYSITSLEDVQQNSNSPIRVGNHVWFGLKCLILKNSNIPDGCVIAANSCIREKFEETNSIIGGYPAKILKRDIRWEV